MEQHLVSSSQFVSLAFRGDIDAGHLPEGTTLTVSLASQQEISKPEFRITQSGPIDVPLFAFVPAGVRYKVSVSEIPEALQLKSITSGITDLMTSPLDLAATAAPTIIQIKFTAREQN